MTRRLAARAAALSLLVTFLPSPLLAGNYTFTNVADSSDKFAVFYTFPSINAAGTVAFLAGVRSGSVGVFSATGGAITRVARLSASSAAVTTSINAKGRVVFFAQFPGGTGIFSARGGPVRTVALSTGPLLRSFRGDPVINEAGQVCFRGQFKDSERGLFLTKRDGTIKTILRSSDPTFKNALGFDLNAGGAVAFSASLDDSGERGIFVSENENIRRVASPSSAVGFSGPAINDAGTVAFGAEIQGDGAGAYVTVGTEVRKIASAARISAVAINNSGVVVFSGDAVRSDDANFTEPRDGIFTGPLSEANRVIAAGDSLFGELVNRVDMNREAINDAGQIAFYYSLQSGQQGIAIATPQL